MHDLYINIIYIKLILKKENNIKLKYNWKETWLEIGCIENKKKKTKQNNLTIVQLQDDIAVQLEFNLNSWLKFHFNILYIIFGNICFKCL